MGNPRRDLFRGRVYGECKNCHALTNWWDSVQENYFCSEECLDKIVYESTQACCSEEKFAQKDWDAVPDNTPKDNMYEGKRK